MITEANKLVSVNAPFASPNALRSQHALQPNVADVYRAPYTTSESIFSFVLEDTNAPEIQNRIGYYFNAGNVEYYLNTAGPGIFANFDFRSIDTRRTALTALNATYNKNISTKFSGAPPYTDYLPVIRYAEVLLSLAEAEAQVGSLSRARDLLDAVHKRSDPNFQFGTPRQADLIAAIFTERRIELLAEGFRTNDLLRRGQPIQAIGDGGFIGTTESRYIFNIP